MLERRIARGVRETFLEIHVVNSSIDKILVLRMTFLILVFTSEKLYYCAQFKVRIVIIYFYWSYCSFSRRFCREKRKL